MIDTLVSLAQLLVLLTLLVWVVKLCKRMRGLNAALKEAPVLVAALDEASVRLDTAGKDLQGRVAAELEAVEERFAGVRRITGDLTRMMRSAEEMVVRLDQTTRTGRRMETARAAAPVASSVEPRGLEALVAARALRVEDGGSATRAGVSRAAPLSYASPAAPLLRQEAPLSPPMAAERKQDRGFSQGGGEPVTRRTVVVS